MRPIVTARSNRKSRRLTVLPVVAVFPLVWGGVGPMYEDTGKSSAKSIVPRRPGMRDLTAIIVAVMSVTTGGPLRCPCQLAALCRGETHSGPVTRTVQPQPKNRCCPCESHADPGLPGPVEPKPSPNSPPCNHHPVIVLAAVHAGAERVYDDREPGDPTAAPVSDIARVLPAHAAGAALLCLAGRSLPPNDRLRYCHAFRS